MDTNRKLRHDAKNVMNAIHLNVEVLRITTSVQERLECLEAIEHAADEGLAWADQIEKHTQSGTQSGNGSGA